MRKTPSAVSLSLLGALVATSACSLSGQGLTRATRLEELKRSYPCSHLPLRETIRRPERDAGLLKEGCWLAGAALANIAKGGAAKIGVAPADTSKVEWASIAAFELKGANGASQEGYWTVDLGMKGRPAGVTAYIYWTSREIKLTNSENPQSGRP